MPRSATLTLARRLSSSSSSAAAAAATGGEGGVSRYLRCARFIDSLRLRLRSHDPSKPFPLPSSPLLDPFVAAQVLRSAHSAAHAASLAASFPSPSSPSLSLLLAKRLAPTGPIPPNLLHSLPLLDRLRLLSAGNRAAALDVWSQIKSAAYASNRHPCTEAYNLVIALHASNRSDSAAVEVFSAMIADGANPNSRTYTVIIDHLISSGNLDSALEIFNLLPSMRIRRTSKQYNVIAGALSSANRFEELEYLLKEMKFDGVLPGLAMREAISRLRSAGFTESTGEFGGELSPNEKIRHVVDDGDESGGETDDEEAEEGGNRVRLKPWINPGALARAVEGWDPAEVEVLEAAGFMWTPRLVCKMLRAFRRPETAWEFFCWVAYQPGDFSHNPQTVSRMITILARSGHVELVERLLSKLQSEKIQLPFATVRLAVDFYGLSKKFDAAVKFYRSAESVCGPLSKTSRVLLCSSLLRTAAKCKKMNEAMELVEEMIGNGVLLDVQTFSGLMQYFAEEGDLKGVHRLFGLARQCGVEPDGYTYRILIRAYCKNRRAALALRVFEEMRTAGLVPDKGTKGLLVKSLWKEGKLVEAATVEERCEGVGDRIPVALPGHVWTVSEADFRRVCDIYSGCFKGSQAAAAATQRR